MFRSATFIKTFHAAVFLLITVALGMLIYEVIVNRITLLGWISVAVIGIEGAVLIFNNWECPLTGYAEELGAEDGQVANLFLPEWLAERVFYIYGVLCVAALIALAIRLLPK